MFHGSLKGSFSCAPGAGGRRNPVQWRVGRPAGGRDFVFAAGARRVFFFLFLLRVRGKFTHSIAARRLRASTAERHPVSGARFCLCCGCAASSLTHSLPAARSTRSKKKKRAAHPQQKKRAPHTQQKSTHNKKINTPTGFRANGTWHTVRDPQRT